MLTFNDFLILSLINLALAGIVAYVVNYAKRSAELSVEEVVNDKEHLKKLIRGAISETRTVLTELRVHEFNIPTGRRRLSRMNALVEKLSLADEELATKVWELVNAPTLVTLAEEAYKRVENDTSVIEYKRSLKENYFKDLEWALKRCAEIEKKPL